MNTAFILAPAWLTSNPPGNVAILSTIVKNAGHSVRCFDFNIELYHLIKTNKFYPNSILNQASWESGSNIETWYNKGFNKQVVSEYNDIIDQWISEVLNTDPDVVFFTVYAVSLLFSIEISKRLKEKKDGIVVVFGGPECFPNASGKDIFSYSQSVDYVCYTEGEQAILNLLQKIKTNEQDPFVDGFYSKSEDGTIKEGNNYSFISDLDSLPTPDFSDFFLEKYDSRAIPLNTSRGCVNRCSFCNDNVYWGKFRSRSAQYIYRDISSILEHHPLTETICFTDSLINGNIRMLDELCSLIIQNKLNIKWIASAYIRKEMTLAFLIKLKQAGCVSLNFGLENASDKVLKLMRKGYNSKLAREVFEDCVKAGIVIYANIIVGHPGETHTNFLQTVRFVHFFMNRYNLITNTINACGLSKGSFLKTHTEQFAIQNSFADTWQTTDNTNTKNIRDLRLHAIKKVPFYYVNEPYNQLGFQKKFKLIFHSYLSPAIVYYFIYFEIILRFRTSLLIYLNQHEQIRYLFTSLSLNGIKNFNKIVKKEEPFDTINVKTNIIAQKLTRYKVKMKLINKAQRNGCVQYYEELILVLINRFNPSQPKELLDILYRIKEEELIDKFDNNSVEILIKTAKATLNDD